MKLDHNPTGQPSRRTRPALLAEIVREVDAMMDEGVSGPLSLLLTRLKSRGVIVTEATLRAGDCRAQLEKVWKRRPRSRRSFGPTRGHDLRPVIELVDEIISLKSKIGRVEADLKGEVFDRQTAIESDARSHAVCAKHATVVATKAAEIPKVVRYLAGRGIFPDYKSVAREMTVREHPLHHRTIRRNENYWRPILEFHDIAPPVKPDDPERIGLLRKSSEELGAMVVQLISQLSQSEAKFEASLD